MALIDGLKKFVAYVGKDCGECQDCCYSITNRIIKKNIRPLKSFIKNLKRGLHFIFEHDIFTNVAADKGCSGDDKDKIVNIKIVDKVKFK
jgi:hypothetical protein